jgi:hypothetical protein
MRLAVFVVVALVRAVRDAHLIVAIGVESAHGAARGRKLVHDYVGAQVKLTRAQDEQARNVALQHPARQPALALADVPKEARLSARTRCVVRDRREHLARAAHERDALPLAAQRRFENPQRRQRGGRRGK